MKFGDKYNEYKHKIVTKTFSPSEDVKIKIKIFAFRNGHHCHDCGWKIKI